MAESNPMAALNDLFGGKIPEGWAGLDDNKDPVKAYEAQLQRYQDALVIAAPFRNGQGRKSLDALRRLTTLKPTWDSESREFYSAAAYGFAREGQNSIVRHIERCLDVVDQGAPVEPKQQKET